MAISIYLCAQGPWPILRSPRCNLASSKNGSWRLFRCRIRMSVFKILVFSCLQFTFQTMFEQPEYEIERLKRNVKVLSQENRELTKGLNVNQQEIAGLKLGMSVMSDKVNAALQEVAEVKRKLHAALNEVAEMQEERKRRKKEEQEDAYSLPSEVEEELEERRQK